MPLPPPPAVPRMMARATELISEPVTHSRHQRFAHSLKELLEAIQAIKALLGGRWEGSEGDDEWEGSKVSVGVGTDSGPQSTSTPVASSVPAGLGPRRTREQPRYIGSLGSTHNQPPSPVRRHPGANQS